MKQNSLSAEFRQWLLENYKPGDKIPCELELSKQFHVSRATIREIIIHLSFLRILERGAKRGTFMRSPASEDIAATLSLQLQVGGYGFEEMKQTRLFLETSLAELVIMRISPQSMDSLNELILRMEQAENDAEAADRLDLEFHLQLISVVGNRILKIFSGIMLLMFDKKYRAPFLNQKAIRKSVRDHKKILDAIRQQDAEHLRQLIRDHIQPL